MKEEQTIVVEELEVTKPKQDTSKIKEVENETDQSSKGFQELENEERKKFGKDLDFKRIKKGILILISISIASLAAAFFYNNAGDTVDVLKLVDYRFILIAVGLSALDMLLGGWRNHIFVRIVKPGVSQWLCFRANLANVFLGAVTPSQTGGGVAQLYVLQRNGIKLINGLSISFINWIATLVFFPIAAIISLFILQDQFSEDLIIYIVKYSFVIYFILLIVVALTLWKPILIGKFIKFLGKLIIRVNVKFGTKVDKVSSTIVDKIKIYQESCVLLLHNNKQLIPYSLIITILLYSTKFTMAYFLMRGLGVDGSFLVVFAIQAIITFILYFAPSPGGSGIAEFTTGALMASLITGSSLTFFIMLSRVFLLFIPATLGAFVLMNELRKHIK